MRATCLLNSCTGLLRCAQGLGPGCHEAGGRIDVVQKQRNNPKRAIYDGGRTLLLKSTQLNPTTDFEKLPDESDTHLSLIHI